MKGPTEHPLDFLAFGAHPDDVEMGIGGLLIKMNKKGYRTGIVDLTRGEMGSYGTAETRFEEAEKASQILQVTLRENLDLGDTQLSLSRENILAVTKVIRKLRPSIILSPHVIDWHPDHSATGQLIQQAFFHVRLKKLDLEYPPHYPQNIFYYPCHKPVIPTFIIDISEEFTQKMKALHAYQSQISAGKKVKHSSHTIGISDYSFHVESRCRYFGSLIDVKYGEALLTERPLNVSDPLKL